MKAILTVGVSASGKSTWATEFLSQVDDEQTVWVQVERDQIRKDILIEERIARDLDWDKWDKQWESEVNRRVDRKIEAAAFLGYNLIISDTNLNKTLRQKLIDKLKAKGYEIEIKLFPITFEEAVKRDLRRRNSVGKAVLEKQFKQWEEIFSSQ